MKKTMAEFKQFIMRGNVLDMAIGIIIGVAFGKIVTSLVNDIVMPPVGLLLGRVNFQDLYVNLSGQSYASLDLAKVAGAPTINYGIFLNTIFDFIIVALVIFLIVRMVNRVRQQAEKPSEVTTKECPYCVSTIALKAVRCPNCTSDLT